MNSKVRILFTMYLFYFFFKFSQILTICVCINEIYNFIVIHFKQYRSVQTNMAEAKAIALVASVTTDIIIRIITIITISRLIT